ncbi:hypothetical protein Tco_1380676, partial [Tanacetum coccineum]
MYHPQILHESPPPYQSQNCQHYSSVSRGGCQFLGRRTPSQLRQYMHTYVKNQGPAVYSTGWTMTQVRKLSPEQLQEEFDKIQRAIAFTRAPSHDVPQEES